MTATTNRFKGRYGIRRDEMSDAERQIRMSIAEYAALTDTMSRGIVLGLEFALRAVRDDIGTDGIPADDALGAGRGEPGKDFRILDAADVVQDAEYADYIKAGGWLHIEAWRAYEAERAQLYAIEEPTDEQWRRIGDLDAWLLY